MAVTLNLQLKRKADSVIDSVSIYKFFLNIFNVDVVNKEIKINDISYSLSEQDFIDGLTEGIEADTGGIIFIQNVITQLPLLNRTDANHGLKFITAQNFAVAGHEGQIVTWNSTSGEFEYSTASANNLYFNQATKKIMLLDPANMAIFHEVALSIPEA